MRQPATIICNEEQPAETMDRESKSKFYYCDKEEYAPLAYRNMLDWTWDIIEEDETEHHTYLGPLQPNYKMRL